MSISQTLNQKKRFVVPAMIVIILSAIFAIFYQIRSLSGSQSAPGVYFTVDNGQTWYSEDKDTVPPVMRDGKEAVRAYVYACNGKKFVAYLERLTPAAKAAMEKVKADVKAGNRPDTSGLAGVMMSGRQIKRPSDKDWTTGVGPQMSAITTVTCDDKSFPELVR